MLAAPALVYRSLTNYWAGVSGKGNRIIPMVAKKIFPVRPGYVHCQILIFSAVPEFYSVKKKECGRR
jgi:hypothetical protein